MVKGEGYIISLLIYRQGMLYKIISPIKINTMDIVQLIQNISFHPVLMENS